jgi:hypothetical protein
MWGVIGRNRVRDANKKLAGYMFLGRNRLYMAFPSLVDRDDYRYRTVPLFPQRMLFLSLVSHSTLRGSSTSKALVDVILVSALPWQLAMDPRIPLPNPTPPSHRRSTYPFIAQMCFTDLAPRASSSREYMRVFNQ